MTQWVEPRISSLDGTTQLDHIGCGCSFDPMTVRPSDSHSMRVMGLEVYRDNGNYVGIHRLTYSWAANVCSGTWFRVNIGMGARR